MPEHPDGLAAARRVATHGHCLFCEEPLVQPRHGRRFVCGALGCKRAYMNAYKRDRRAGVLRSSMPRSWRVRWTCGCGRNYCHQFFRNRHRYRCLFAPSAWPIVIVPRGVAA